MGADIDAVLCQVARNEGGLSLRVSSAADILDAAGKLRSDKSISPVQTESDESAFGTREDKIVGCRDQRAAWDANVCYLAPIFGEVRPPLPRERRLRGVHGRAFAMQQQATEIRMDQAHLGDDEAWARAAFERSASADAADATRLDAARPGSVTKVRGSGCGCGPGGRGRVAVGGRHPCDAAVIAEMYEGGVLFEPGGILTLSLDCTQDEGEESASKCAAAARRGARASAHAQGPRARHRCRAKHSDHDAARRARRLARRRGAARRPRAAGAVADARHGAGGALGRRRTHLWLPSGGAARRPRPLPAGRRHQPAAAVRF